jgi:hypothetical protein
MTENSATERNRYSHPRASVLSQNAVNIQSEDLSSGGTGTLPEAEWSSSFWGRELGEFDLKIHDDPGQTKNPHLPRRGTAI